MEEKREANKRERTGLLGERERKRVVRLLR